MVAKRNVILINIVIVSCKYHGKVYYYYCLSNISIPFHSDDAGSTFALMDDKFFGGNSYLHNSYSIFAILERICCNIWGYTEFSTILVFGIQFFIMFFLTAIIFIEKNDTWKLSRANLHIWLDVRIVGSRGSCRNPDLKISHWTNHYPVTDFVGRKKDAGDNKEKL